MKRDDVYYQALKSRDPRFDGKFFTGVKTTGIYCRPICPAQPKRENVEFFQTHFEAERSGYRPCLRCRPESAPLSPVWIGKSAIVQRALKVLHRPDTLDFDEDHFAAIFGVSARHLRRLFNNEIGKTPKQLSFENRLNLARKLIVETSLSQSAVAHASGFKSIRRYNDAFKIRFKKSPQQIRKHRVKSAGPLIITLPYRPPFDFEGLLRFYESHRVVGLEWFTPGNYHRTLEYNGKSGQVTVSNDPARSELRLAVDFPDTTILYALIAQVRAMFDLDSDPVLIANCLELEPYTKKLLRKYPGIRLPSGWDPHEIAVGCISKGIKNKLVRKRALLEFSRAIAEKKISMQSTQDVHEFIRQLLLIPGIDLCTAEIIAMRALRHTDAFPQTDLVMARALQRHPLKKVQNMSPWRGYAAALYWREYAEQIKRSKK